MILTQSQLAFENSLRRILPPGVVSCWIPDGYDRVKDVIGGNHGRCSGTHPNVPIIGGFPIDQISACDAVTDWIIGANGVLSVDTGDKIEGIGSLKVTAAAPGIGEWYEISFNPAGIWDWSAKESMLFGLKCDRPQNEFSVARIMVLDTSYNWRIWNLTFSAGAWTGFRCLLSTGDAESATPPDLALINYVKISFYTKDTTAFYYNTDKLRVTGRRSLTYPSVGWVKDGVDDFINCGADASLDINPTTKQWALGAWINPLWFKDPLTDSAAVLWGMNSYGIRLEDPNVIRLYVRDTVGWKSAFKTGYSTNNYYFIAGVLNGSRLSLNINGVEVASYSTVGTLEDPDGVFLIGSQTVGARRFKGSIVLPFVAKEAWSVAQLANFYNATKGMFAPRG